jgi:hypothetical protein
MREMVHIAKGHKQGNCLSLLRASPTNANESSMLILQETWTDASGSFLLYAPVDIPSINVVMGGGDPAYVALLPSGFAILPDERSSYGRPKNCNGTMVKAGDDLSAISLVDPSAHPSSEGNDVQRKEYTSTVHWGDQTIRSWIRY